MAEIVMVAAASHAPGLAGWFDKAPAPAQQHVRRGYDTLRETLIAAEPDAVIVFANDHLANFRVTSYPDFVVCVGARHRGPDEWFQPWLRMDEYTVPGNPQVAGPVFEGLRRRGVGAFAQDANPRLDDNISVPVALLGWEELGIPLIPVLHNCTVPPVPDERSCWSVGAALGQLIREDLPGGLRIGLLASGGLAHEPGGPRYFDIDEAFDRQFLELLEKGDHGALLAEATYERMEAAGAGGTSELLSWILVMGAIGDRPAETLCYEAVEQWRSGVGAVRWEL